ncbi:phage virion morphogenesis protein [bacterium]|nr:phage virion morphogenesis protein [bacterium]
MQVEIKDDKFTQMLAKMENACIDMTPLYKKIYYEVMLPSIMRNFSAQGRYSASSNRLDAQKSIIGGSHKWAPLRKETIARKRKKYGKTSILQASGSLKGGVHARITKSELGISSVKYGNYAQFGTKFMPERPWLTVQEADRRKITKIIKQYLSELKKR